MVWLKDIVRVANGLSLVAKEALGGVVRQSQWEGGGGGGGGGGRGDFLLLQSLIKKTILSATDLTGLTKGKLRPLSSIPITTSSNNINDDTSATTPNNTSQRDLEWVDSELQQAQPLPQADSYPFPPVSCVSDDNTATAASCSDGSGERIFCDLSTEDATAAAPPPPSSSPPPRVDTSADADTVSPRQNAPPLVKKPRKARERRVPSTPFSRALG